MYSDCVDVNTVFFRTYPLICVLANKRRAHTRVIMPHVVDIRRSVRYVRFGATRIMLNAYIMERDSAAHVLPDNALICRSLAVYACTLARAHTYNRFFPLEREYKRAYA